MKWAMCVGVLLAGVAIAASPGASPETLDGYERFVQPDGSFVFSGPPVRDGLAHLGEWFVPEGPAAGFHHVYTQPAAIEAYRATGVFPDGAVLVKELRKHRTANYTTGTGVASATEVTQWFLMVKDAKGRFPDSPLWREGWGWALFKADAPGVNAATSFQADCQGCHIPARATDWVYTIGYPRLAR
jgi:hypothetical protein